ncbi:MAG TPA: hypothetical protein VHL50_01755, partial [Pyrinomonadaceae bacterium]|nr:hypothetical protein [Pyrinomonadaceae bacterium]
VNIIEQFPGLPSFANISREQTNAAGPNSFDQAAGFGVKLRAGNPYKKELPDFFFDCKIIKFARRHNQILNVKL